MLVIAILAAVMLGALSRARVSAKTIEAIVLVGWTTLAVYCSWVALRLFVWCWQPDAFYWAFRGILW